MTVMTCADMIPTLVPSSPHRVANGLTNVSILKLNSNHAVVVPLSAKVKIAPALTMRFQLVANMVHVPVSPKSGFSSQKLMGLK
jgi:hypothetical protein